MSAFAVPIVYPPSTSNAFDRPIGTFLSGGLDSSIVAAFIMKFLKESGKEPRLNTFSIGLEGSPDLAYSEIVANYIKSQHHHVEIEVE